MLSFFNFFSITLAKDVLPILFWPFIKHFRFAPVYTQFGCPYSCSYCASSLTSVTIRSIENLKEEIRLIHKEGYREIHFGDETFGNPKKYIKNHLNRKPQNAYSPNFSI